MGNIVDDKRNDQHDPGPQGRGHHRIQKTEIVHGIPADDRNQGGGAAWRAQGLGQMHHGCFDDASCGCYLSPCDYFKVPDADCELDTSDICCTLVKT
jgi:hypothetical protein